MKIYFNASNSAKADFEKSYRHIVEDLEKKGHKVFHDHILDYDLKDRREESKEDRKEYYQDMLRKIKAADLMVAEISFPSTVHVGHELTLALDYNKPVLALHQAGKRPVLFWGVDFERFLVAEYDVESLGQVLDDSLSYLQDQADTRFNFFISPKQATYLDWISKQQRIPRSVYLRNLIKADRKKNAEFQAA